jgi:exodeoxyribonuclease VII small subunit
MMANVKDAPLNLEARLMRLELIVEALEREDLELEEALRLFEEGIGHIRATREILIETELRIEQLLSDGSGSSILEPGVAASDG